jgi:HNH endonuclease/AP2 domain
VAGKYVPAKQYGVKMEKTYMTQERLKEFLHYDPESGEWTWLPNKHFAGRMRIDRRAGSKQYGYIDIRFDGVLYKAHRLAWFYMTGILPEKVDHINMKRDDNRWVNLREATNQKNAWNRTVQSNNKIGLKGVSWHKQGSKWRAVIFVEGKQKHLGLWDDPQMAHEAYMAAAKLYHGEFARA